MLTSFLFLHENICCGTHNICFRGEIRKILCGYPLLSVAMDLYLKSTFCVFTSKFIFCNHSNKQIKGHRYTFKGENSAKIVLLPSEKGSTLLKRKEQTLPFRLDPYSERVWCARRQKITKVVTLFTKWWLIKSIRSIQRLIILLTERWSSKRLTRGKCHITGQLVSAVIGINGFVYLALN